MIPPSSTAHQWNEHLVRSMAESLLPSATPGLLEADVGVLHLGTGREFSPPALGNRHGAVRWGRLHGVPCVAIGVQPGTFALEHAFALLLRLKVRQVIAIGFCGALRHTLPTGEVGLVRETIGLDGISAAFGGETERSPVRNVEAPHAAELQEYATRAGFKLHPWKVVTTGSLLAENAPRIESWRDYWNADVVEMEAAALVQLCREYDVSPPTIFLVVTDNPSSGEVPDFAGRAGYLVDRGIIRAEALVEAILGEDR